MQTIGVEFDIMHVHEQKSIEMLTYENLYDIGESIRELRMKKRTAGNSLYATGCTNC
ncbi:hypothetical protein OL548_24450 [Lysinibacillus sp. MHQ-1]|nr:hypothetical protein OL548_24450 [Lysinibacillus sp. MHQ-1]